MTAKSALMRSGARAPTWPLLATPLIKIHEEVESINNYQWRQATDGKCRHSELLKIWQSLELVFSRHFCLTLLKITRALIKNIRVFIKTRL